MAFELCEALRASGRCEGRATRGDVEVVRKELAEARSEIVKELAKLIMETQRWTLGAIFAAVAAIIKLL